MITSSTTSKKKKKKNPLGSHTARIEENQFVCLVEGLLEWVIDVPCFLCMLKYFRTSCFTGPIVQKQRRNLVVGFDWLGGLYMKNSSIASQVP